MPDLSYFREARAGDVCGRLQSRGRFRLMALAASVFVRAVGLFIKTKPVICVMQHASGLAEGVAGYVEA